jgi:hypothetical protein
MTSDQSGTNDDVAAEVERLHGLLSQWLGLGAEVLDSLRAAHADDFRLISTDGGTMTVDELFGSLAGARNAVPGLVIAVDEIATVAEAGDLVVVRFRETHRHGGDTTRRVTTAVLRRTGQGFRWQHVHETADIGS